MNLLASVFVILFLLQGYKGFKRGFTREVNGLVSLVVTLAVLAAVFLLVSAIREKSGKVMAVSAVFLILIGLAYQLLGILLRSADRLARLPLFDFANKLLGAAAGALKAVVIFWIVYVVIDRFPFGRFGEQIMMWTGENTLLMNIYKKNFIANWLSGWLVR